MDELFKTGFKIILNEGGGAVSVLLAINIWLLWKMTKRFASIDKAITGVNDLIKSEIADIELNLVKKYVVWEKFDKLNERVDEQAMNIARLSGRMNGK